MAMYAAIIRSYTVLTGKYVREIRDHVDHKDRNVYIWIKKVLEFTNEETCTYHSYHTEIVASETRTDRAY